VLGMNYLKLEKKSNECIQEEPDVIDSFHEA